ncbi:hypothetical protein [Nocardia abscessus]|uniref:hypothetical protein n=1 Tax=Nocardia abscessus TaxID=120957 RepID=UPI0024549AC5|nr:hypothetical protein [Nocardia abscessus]
MNWKYWRNAIGFFVLATIAGIGVLSVGIYGEGYGREDDKRNLYIFGGILAATAVLGTFLENHMAERARSEARDRAIKAEAQMTELYNKILAPTTRRMRDEVYAYVTKFPRGATPVDATTQMNFDILLDAILKGAVDLIAPPTPAAPSYGARAAFYKRTPAGDYNLVAYYPVTTSNVPRSTIEGSRPEGSHIATHILKSPPALWKVDGKNGNISYMKTAHSRYEGVIAAPVACNGRLYGMLSVDVPDASKLINEHEDLVQALADVIATNLLMMEP